MWPSRTLLLERGRGEAQERGGFYWLFHHSASLEFTHHFVLRAMSCQNDSLPDAHNSQKWSE